MDHTNEKFAWSIGLKLRVKTTLNEQFEGEIFNYDPSTTCLTLICDDGTMNMGGKRIVRVLLETSIAEANVIGGPSNHFNELPPLNIQNINKRQEKALKQAENQASKIGIGVTAEAQEIFYALSKTLPCHWKGKNIIVLNDITIDSPYNVENCSGTSSHSLERVKQILDKERKKLALNKQRPNTILLFIKSM
ncbi:hypothetical protein DFA_10564 [Cavenderia fasciculata]|uniref:AD domain-containing protein n=1 Tax=Cavenderia fasciculata TaxID=261658 RepID=F4QAK3_CACFS|nr:uncharacterized protein DFA_10564 [Cavenderia fasciculata]EGG15722.1 hypothetical protein DFA_10564 [Cavenderia fasciculata]|eukprot:XP_004354464.1 hypothetical protein DFA_10564 [Cavenderia fasciculata]